MKHLHAFTSHRDRCRRYFVTYRLKGNDLRRIEGHVEIATPATSDSAGFRLHLGDRGSETPVDVMLDLNRVKVFAGINFPGLGAFCEWAGRGHKRDLLLRVAGGHLWWKLWFDDDGGHDRHHNCDSWRQPRVWPWSRGRRKHRGWMCLRDGNIALNPASALWGTPKFQREKVESRTALVAPRQFDGDEYPVEVALERYEVRREHGPRWARRVLRSGFTAEWDTRGLCGGIPIRNHDWKGDEILAGTHGGDVDPDRWVADVVDQLVTSVRRDRERYGYRPPAGA